MKLQVIKGTGDDRRLALMLVLSGWLLIDERDKKALRALRKITWQLLAELEQEAER